MLDEEMFYGGYERDFVEKNPNEKFKKELSILKEDINKNLSNFNPFINLEKIDVKINRKYSKINVENLCKKLKDVVNLTKDINGNKTLSEIISFQDMFIFKTYNSIIQINKNDIFEINLSKISDNNIQIILKNNLNKIEIFLDHLCYNFNIDNLDVTIHFSYDKEKLKDFLFDEIKEYISEKGIYKCI